jgi:hypothetical protein
VNVTYSEEEAVRLVTQQFYQALDDLVRNGGTERMEPLWHHEACTSAVHPFGHWAIGWEEVWASWQETAALFSYYRGHAGRDEGIGAIHDLRVTVAGEMAFTVGVYRSVVHFPDHSRPLSVNCTDVLVKRSGVWKMVHHHADQADPDYLDALHRLVES